jgi:curved DNA-binding protein
MIFKDYYKILDIETSRVGIDDIKNAYRTAAKKHHPDLNVGNKLAEEKIKDINEAYRVLSDAKSKKKYDRLWNANVGKKKAFKESGRSSNSVFSDFFYMFFGDVEEKENFKEVKKLPVKGENVEVQFKVNVEEAFFGAEKTIAIKTPNEKIKSFTVAIPEGIKDGEKVRLIGQGKPGANGGKNGDLFIKINFENKGKFKVIDDDIHMELLLTPWEAALGARTQLNTIDGMVQVYIPQGTQTGEVIKIPHKGYKKENGERGDLVAEIKVMVPKKLTEQEKTMFEKLSQISSYNPRS